MSVCLTKKQSEFFKFITEFKAKNGFYPGQTEAARILNRSAPAIGFLYGSLFLRGVFTDGKPQTRFHANAHVRVERKAKAVKKPAAKKPAAKKPVTNGELATLLVKLLSGGNVSRDAAISAILSASE